MVITSSMHLAIQDILYWNMSGQVDDMFAALADRYRRRLLFTLLDHDPGASVAVPEAIHYGEVDPDMLFTSMYHVHLPKLADMGFVEWDRTAHTVIRGPRFSTIQSFLQLLVNNRDVLPADCAGC